MMEGMRLTFVHCDIRRSTQPHFVANVMKIIVQSVLTHKLVGTQLLITRYVSCVKQVGSQIWSCVVWFVGKGLGLI